MANHSGRRDRQSRPAAPRQPGTPAFKEPEVRRWPHPVEGTALPPSGGCQPRSPRQLEAGLYYIHCALSYQNQMLADIKTLLEQLSADSREKSEEK